MNVDNAEMPFGQDNTAIALAEAAGLEYVRLAERVIVEDPSLVPLEYTRRQPDKATIRRALQTGRVVPGCRLGEPGWLLIPKRKEEPEQLLESPAPHVARSPGAGV